MAYSRSTTILVRCVAIIGIVGCALIGPVLSIGLTYSADKPLFFGFLAILAVALIAAAIHFSKPEERSVVARDMVVLAGICLMFTAILAPVIMAAKPAAKRTQCISNLKQLGTASVIYSSDNDDHLPEASRWMDLLGPVTKSVESLHCPVVHHNGYALNRKLGKAELDTVKNPELLPLMYDSSDLRSNANDNFNSLPTPGRHEDNRDNVCYADSHVHAVTRL
jgi:hypothetical protein